MKTSPAKISSARRVCVLALLSLSSASGLVHADPILGTPVADTSSTSSVGTVNSSGVIGFFIDLSGSSTYGVDGGTSADTCTHPGTCGGGQLTMTLFFAGLGAGTAQFELLFTDLDAEGSVDAGGETVNDPWYFFEQLLVMDGMGNTIATIDSASDLTSGDATNQLVTFNLGVSGDAYLTLVFQSGFLSGAPHGTYRNTKEYLLASAYSVPEPGVLVLLGTGLFLLAAGRRRFV